MHPSQEGQRTKLIHHEAVIDDTLLLCSLILLTGSTGNELEKENLLNKSFLNIRNMCTYFKSAYYLGVLIEYTLPTTQCITSLLDTLAFLKIK